MQNIGWGEGYGKWGLGSVRYVGKLWVVGELGEILVSRPFFSFEGVPLYHWSLRYHISTTPAVVVVYLLTSCALLDVLEVRYLSPLANT